MIDDLGQRIDEHPQRPGVKTGLAVFLRTTGAAPKVAERELARRYGALNRLWLAGQIVGECLENASSSMAGALGGRSVDKDRALAELHEAKQVAHWALDEARALLRSS